MNPQVLRYLIADILTKFGLYSLSAEHLLMGTAAQESNFIYLRQMGGPARGLFQMEPNTEKDIWDNYLKYKSELANKLAYYLDRHSPGPWLEWDLAYQIIMCRIHYKRVPTILPDANDVWALGKYWKNNYNTVNGKGTVDEFVNNYKRLVK